MSKQAFLTQLREALSGFPQEDIDERLTFYSEMIDDRMEEGLSEEEAVSAVGSVNDIVSQIVAETPLMKLAKERVKPKGKRRTLEIILLILGSPIWLSLLIALFAVILSVYISLWSVIISLWSVFGSLCACSLGAVAAGIVMICGGYVPSGIALMGAALVCAGLSIFMFCGCNAATKGILVLTKKLPMWIKKCFI